MFLTLCFLITTLLDIIFSRYVLKGRELRPSSPSFLIYGVIRMYVPFTSVVITLMYFSGTNSVISFLKSWFRIDYSIIKYCLIAPLYTYVAIGAYIVIIKYLGILDLSKLVKDRRPTSVIKSLVTTLALAYVASLTANALAAIGEEVGWRAYLLPNLMGQVGLFGAIVVSGLIWGAWHIPLVLSIKVKHPLYDPKLSTVGYLVSSIYLSSIASLLTLVTHSVLPTSVFHGSLNAVSGLGNAVTKIRDGRRYEDLIKVSLASLISWCFSTVLTTYLITTLLT